MSADTDMNTTNDETKLPEQTDDEITPEEKERQEQEKQKQEEEERQRFNRQINYFIMRYMWQVVCGRSKRYREDSIYNAFHTSRERYTRVINTGVIRYANNELDSLYNLTGISRDIFTGKQVFNCYYIVSTEIVDSQTKKGKKVNKRVPIAISEWESMFRWRANRKPKGNNTANSNQGIKKKTGKTPQDIICDKLKNMERTNRDNLEFYKLCYYLENREPAPVKTGDNTLREIEQSIMKMSFTLLDKADIGYLQKLQKLIKGKSQMIGGIIAYKTAQAEEKKMSKDPGT